MTEQREPPHPLHVSIVLVLGVLAVSTAALFIRLAMMAAGKQGLDFSLFLASSRLVLASLVLAPTWRQVRQTNLSASAYLYAIAAGVALAAHFVLWISSLSFLSIAASTTLVTTNPIWVAILSWWWWRVPLSRQSLIGIVLGIIGSGLVALGDRGSSGMIEAPVLGSFLALAGSWMVSVYFLFGREAQRQGLFIQHYAAIAYSSAALVLFPVSLLWGVSYWGYPAAVYAYVLGMTLFAQLWGHTSLNWAMRWMSPIIVMLCILFEPVAASILGFIFLGEIPSFSVIGGGCMVLIGVAIALWQPKEPEAS